MIEIAFCLLIIGFALVAILAVLPIGMNTQKVNREETIINKDATVFMNGLRNGAQGLDYLTNYVVAITNWQTDLNADGTPILTATNVYGYTYSNFTVNGIAGSPQYFITNGLRIIGLLGTPKYEAVAPGGRLLSNYVVAYVRSISGAASEKFPQTNPDVRDLAFSYRMTSEVIPFGVYSFDQYWTNGPLTGPVLNNLQANLHDVRLIFLWPLFPNGQVGRSGQAFRTLAGGTLVRTNEPGFAGQVGSPYDLYFFEPQNYVKAP